MESGNPLLDDYVLGLCEAERPRVCFLPSASGDADHYVVRFYRAFSGRALRGQPHLALPPRAGARGPARAPALPGPDLRRRRQRDQPARRLAGARHRRHPARSLGGRGRPLRPLRRLAVLVRGSGDRLPRRAAAGRGPGPAAVQQLRPLRAELRAPPRLPRVPARGHAPRLRGRGRRRAALRRHRAATGSSPRGRRPAATGSTRWASEWSRCGSRPPTSGTARPVATAPACPEAIATAAAPGLARR